MSNMKRKMRRKKVQINKIIFIMLFIVLLSLILIIKREKIFNILGNKNKLKISIPSEMKIGDIINYNHKISVNSSDSKNLTTTIERRNFRQTWLK